MSLHIALQMTDNNLNFPITILTLLSLTQADQFSGMIHVDPVISSKDGLI